MLKSPLGVSFRGGRRGDRRRISRGLHFHSEIPPLRGVYPERANAEIPRSARNGEGGQNDNPKGSE